MMPVAIFLNKCPNDLQGMFNSQANNHKAARAVACDDRLLEVCLLLHLFFKFAIHSFANSYLELIDLKKRKLTDELLS